ncbi:hypothetical protein EJB05_00136 [Eragrostis curvula]|uniref:Uncharacterized protein n=1 Tax=Eragrostis curvula TaxID=38414 RepID=A0A5J9WLL7_9POAL|nr:hypothetical protein EJB05_00136 [Eragrostis curvula]
MEERRIVEAQLVLGERFGHCGLRQPAMAKQASGIYSSEARYGLINKINKGLENYSLMHGWNCWLELQSKDQTAA